MGQYLPLVAMLVLALGFCVLSYFGSKLLAPKRPSAAKSAPYECGIVPTQEPPERFPVRFYLVAMIFIVFDIEIIFLYPYAVVYQRPRRVRPRRDRGVRRAGVRLVRLPDRQRRARLGSGQAAPPADAGGGRRAHVVVHGPAGRPRGPRAARPTPSREEAA